MIGIEVRRCGECPFLDAEDHPLWWCSVPSMDARQLHGMNDQRPPEWCPLRAADRLVTLRVS